MDQTPEAADPPIAGPERDVRARRRTRGYLAALGVVVSLGIILMAYNLFTSWLVSREDRRVERCADGEVMRGAEELDLGPKDSTAAVLFVHGFAGATNNFNELPEYVARREYRARVIRLPGHGTSPRDLERVTADQLVDTVVAEAEALRRKHEKVYLVGHSMGGALCTIAASRVPVDGLVLGGAYFGVTHRWYYGLRPETWTKLTSPAVRWVYKGRLFLQVNRKEAKDHIVSYTWLPSKAGLTLTEVGRRANDPAVMNSVKCPVLMLHSHGDVAASPEAAEAAFDRIAADDKSLVWIDKSNHHVFWDYDHESVRDLVLSFVSARLLHFPEKSTLAELEAMRVVPYTPGPS